jgi:hypothetical protein
VKKRGHWKRFRPEKDGRLDAISAALGFARDWQTDYSGDEIIKIAADSYDGLGDRFEGADPGSFLAVTRCKSTTGPACHFISII